MEEDALYEAMDALNGYWVGMEQRLHAARDSKGVKLVLYDLSSVYFEGRGQRG